MVGENTEDTINPKYVPYESPEGTARYLGIPVENISNPIVKEFIDFINRVHGLQEDLAIAASERSILRVINEPTRDRQEQYRGISAMSPKLADRYSSAELLMRSAATMLEAGLAGNEADPAYMRRKLNAAVGHYGLKVVDDTIPNEQSPLALPEQGS